MSLFQRNPHEMSKLPLFTLGSNKDVLIVGLGNPGKEYEGTRHNVGFAVIDELSKTKDFPNWIAKKDLKCEISIHNIGQCRVILVKPTTFMNLSGEAVNAVQKFYRVYNSATLVIHDELALPFGQIRTRLGGSDAGHNGIKSLIQYVGDDFGRLRIGVKSEIAEKSDAAEFVLKKFSKEEQGKLPAIIKEAVSKIDSYIASGELPHNTKTI